MTVNLSALVASAVEAVNNAKVLATAAVVRSRDSALSRLEAAFAAARSQVEDASLTAQVELHAAHGEADAAIAAAIDAGAASLEGATLEAVNVLSYCEAGDCVRRDDFISAFLGEGEIEPAPVCTDAPGTAGPAVHIPPPMTERVKAELLGTLANLHASAEKARSEPTPADTDDALKQDTAPLAEPTMPHDIVGPHGRCDACGSPCDAEGCTADRNHAIADGEVTIPADGERRGWFGGEPVEATETVTVAANPPVAEAPAPEVTDEQVAAVANFVANETADVSPEEVTAEVVPEVQAPKPKPGKARKPRQSRKSK